MYTNAGEFKLFLEELLFQENLSDPSIYSNEFGLKEESYVQFSPCLTCASGTLEEKSIPTAEFYKNQESYLSLINSETSVHNIGLFENVNIVAKHIDWNQYHGLRISHELYYPTYLEIDNYIKLEEVIFSNEKFSNQFHALGYEELVELSGYGVVFSEKTYRDIFDGDLSITNTKAQDFITKLLKIDLDPYVGDEEYRHLHLNSINHTRSRNYNSSLGLSKLNNFLSSLDYFKLLSKLQ